MEPYKVIDRKGAEIETDVSLHPGEVLSMEIEARQIKKSDLANALSIKPGNLTELLKGKRHVSALLAIKIEALMGIEASFWMRVQSNYDLQTARQKITRAMNARLKKNRMLLQRKTHS